MGKVRKKLLNIFILFMIFGMLFNCISITNVQAEDSRKLYDVIAKQAVLDNEPSEFVTGESGIDFSKGSSDTNGKGVYTLADTKDDNYPVYYYRGDVKDNNILFANFCWKIVRTTETGGTKLIYNGVPVEGKCDNIGVNSQIGTSKYNNQSDAISYVGYMYGESYPSKAQYLKGTKNYVYGNDVTYSNGSYKLKDTFTSELWNNDYETVKNKYHYTCFSNTDTCENVYYINYVWDSDGVLFMTLSDGKKVEDLLKESATESSNENDSAIKKVIDEWYQANLFDYTLQLEDSKWCNDRSIGLYGIFDKEYNSSDYLNFNSILRLKNAKLRLECSKNDSFTVNNTSGNQKLTYPIGLLVSDEINYAGGAYYVDNFYYLNNLLDFWINSPFTYTNSVANITFVENTGAIKGKNVSKESGVRPAISLANNMLLTTGDGSVEDPYQVEQGHKLTIDTEEELKELFKEYDGNLYVKGEKVNLDILKVGDEVNGYKFIGYESSDVEIDENGTFIMLDKDVVIKAKFEKVPGKEIQDIIKNPNTTTFVGIVGGLFIISGIAFMVLKKVKLKNKYNM